MLRLKGRTNFSSFLSLAIILLLAFLLRVINIDNNPAGFFCDEASIGYNAYSLLKTGQDEYGSSWPLFFRAFGEYKNPILIYSSIIPIYFFGLNEGSVRLTSAFYGVLGVLAIYLLARRMGGKKLGLWAALFLAISPWHLHFSRTALEGLMPFVFFTTLGAYFWLIYRQENRDLFKAIFCFALALYSYFPARLFIPLFCGSLAFLARQQLWKDKRKLLLSFLFLLVLIFPLFSHTFFGPGFSRWNQVAESKTAFQFFKLYWDHFSIDFLFFLGDASFPGQFITRHSLANRGELYFFQIILLVLGWWSLFKKRSVAKEMIVFWFLFYPVGTIFTQTSGPQATRSIIGVVPFQIISAMGIVTGFYWLRARIKKEVVFKLTMGLIYLVVICSLVVYLMAFKNYPFYSADYWGWQYGSRPIIEYFLRVSPYYDQLLMTDSFNAPQIFLRFYDPKEKCFSCRVGNLADFNPQLSQLFAIRVEEEKKWQEKGISYRVKEQIFYPSGHLAFLIIEPF